MKRFAFLCWIVGCGGAASHPGADGALAGRKMDMLGGESNTPGRGMRMAPGAPGPDAASEIADAGLDTATMSDGAPPAADTAALPRDGSPNSLGFDSGLQTSLDARESAPDAGGLRPLGAPCTNGAVCGSGFCAGRRCCDSKCDSPCQKCDTGYCENLSGGRCNGTCDGVPVSEKDAVPLFSNGVLGPIPGTCKAVNYVCQDGACVPDESSNWIMDCCHPTNPEVRLKVCGINQSGGPTSANGTPVRTARCY